MIELSIFEKAGKKSLFIYFGIGGIIIFALYLLFPTCNPLIFILPIIGILVILSITELNEKPVGNLYLSKWQILIKTRNADVKSELSRISKLKLKYSGYQGKRVPGDLFPRFNQFSGSDNYISIDLGTEVFEYRFLIEDEEQEKQLVELIGDWEKMGFDVSDITVNI